jgi:hypothetical protein
MSTVQVGMTRADLLKVFREVREEGGLSTGIARTYAYRECPYFKIKVELSAVGRPDRDADGRVTLVEPPQALIKKVSTPVLELPIGD